MPEIKEPYQFEPSKASKLKWLWTRKQIFQINAIALPGLFSTYQYSLDRLGFYVVLTLEIIGLWYIFFISDSIQTFFYCIGMFFIDFILAFLFRSQEGKIRIYKNYIFDYKAIEKTDFKAFDTPPGKAIDTLPEKENKWILLKYIFGSLLVFTAICKIMFVCFIKPISINLTLIAVFVSYLLVIYLQLKHTGYFLLELNVKFHFNRDYKKFNQSSRQDDNLYMIKGYRIFPFYSSSALDRVDIDGRHFLEEIASKGVDGYNYQFRTWGILTDDDLINFISNQRSQKAKYNVAINGHKHQMQILNQDVQSREEKSKDNLNDDNEYRDLLKKEENIKSVLEDIKNNETATALEKIILFLGNYKNDHEQMNIILNLQSQLNKLTKDSQKGIIGYEEGLRIRARINDAILEITNELH